MAPIVYAGTSGQGAWYSTDLGETWKRPLRGWAGMYLESRVWALAAHPQEPRFVYAGTETGIYRWDVNERLWTHLPSPMDTMQVWSLTMHPKNPAVLYAGTRPAALFRSSDAGRTWDRIGVEFSPTCEFIFHPRVTTLFFDPTDERTLWAGAEIDGVRRSTDSGRTWQTCNNGLPTLDIHGMAVVQNGSKAVFATTNEGLFRSEDNGASWRHLRLNSTWQYTRTIWPRADGKGTVFLTNGDGPPGSTGRLWRSRDYGATWEDAGLPPVLNSTPWCIATNAADPNLIFVCSNLGQFFRSTDGGETWRKLARELGEVRALMWTA